MRKEVDIVISADGRDKGKTFHLTEMYAMDGDAWARRALSAVAKHAPEGMLIDLNGGWPALAEMGVKAILSAIGDDATSLIEEMTTCIQIKETLVTRPLILRSDDIEEISTIIKLRDEVIRLHANFSIIEIALKFGEVIRTIIENSPTTPTSATQSEPSSPFG